MGVFGVAAAGGILVACGVGAGRPKARLIPGVLGDPVGAGVGACMCEVRGVIGWVFWGFRVDGSHCFVLAGASLVRPGRAVPPLSPVNRPPVLPASPLRELLQIPFGGSPRTR